MIMKGRVPLRLPAAGVFTIALTAAATLPAWATGQQTAPPSPPAAASPAVQAVPAPPAPAVKPSTAPTPASRRSAPLLVALDQQPPPPPPAVVLRDERRSVPVQASTPPAPQVVKKQTTVTPKVASVPPQWKVTQIFASANLPAEGQQLMQTYDAEVAAIYKEIEQKVEARRQAAIKSLEALQDQLTKAGKLDEAVAVRDYLRAGGPPAANTPFRYTFFNKGK